MNLGDIITALETANPQQVVAHGFHNPHSYRGDYMDLAFEPAQNISVAAMLTAARSALGTTYQGYKGGDFTMSEDSWCWLSEQGDASGETISALLLKFMLAPPVDRAAVLREAATIVHNAFHGEPYLNYPPDFAALLQEKANEADAPLIATTEA